MSHPAASAELKKRLLRAALRAQGKELPAREFLNTLGREMEALKMDPGFKGRAINDGYSGGDGAGEFAPVRKHRAQRRERGDECGRSGRRPKRRGRALARRDNRQGVEPP